MLVCQRVLPFNSPLRLAVLYLSSRYCWQVLGCWFHMLFTFRLADDLEWLKHIFWGTGFTTHKWVSTYMCFYLEGWKHFDLLGWQWLTAWFSANLQQFYIPLKFIFGGEGQRTHQRHATTPKEDCDDAMRIKKRCEVEGDVDTRYNRKRHDLVKKLDGEWRVNEDKMAGWPETDPVVAVKDAANFTLNGEGYTVPSGKLTVGPWKSPIFRGKYIIFQPLSTRVYVNLL